LAALNEKDKEWAEKLEAEKKLGSISSSEVRRQIEDLEIENKKL
jgi:hypothetical protein